MNLFTKILVSIITLFVIRGEVVKADVNNKTLAILVNENDPESLEIARYYQKARGIPAENIISLNFKHNIDELSISEFNEIEMQLKERVDDEVQAYVLAWRKPWRVNCMSITSAFTLGFNESYCAKGCKLTKPVKYYNSPSGFPYRDHKIRPSMMLSGGSLQSVFKLIDNGVAADYTRPKGTAYLMSTSDKQRNVRMTYYPLIQNTLSNLFKIKTIEADAVKNANDVMFYFTGQEKVKWISGNNFLPGAIADHLTSTGGHLFDGSQMSIIDWIDSGVTGSYGTVTEPCNFVQKFPNPAIVMQKYFSGDTLIESYWKSVKMPGQGVFVGEPLAAPYKGCELKVDKNKRFFYANMSVMNLVMKSSKKCH